MKAYPQLAARMFGVPLAIHPLKAKVIAQALAGRFDIRDVTIVDASGRPMAGDWYGEDDGFSEEAKPDPGYDVVQGVAIINIAGTLVHRSTSIRPYSGMLGYNAIRQAFLGALEDSEVRAIVLLCNSPGGEVSGCFDLVDTIYAARGDKPITAICDDMAYSACYAIASAADTIVVVDGEILGKPRDAAHAAQRPGPVAHCIHVDHVVVDHVAPERRRPVEHRRDQPGQDRKSVV